MDFGKNFRKNSILSEKKREKEEEKRKKERMTKAFSSTAHFS